ncbi:DDE-type integrase/transposase/recombinase [Candidatus Woesearchaeota archaeon]|nr:DDE-type integrase/transposase/recombinase [Candidatus Woesearchaeota archaeon]
MRVVRGYAIISKGDTPRRIDENKFYVPSQNNDKVYYVVTRGKKWKCSCPDFMERKKDCKHIHAVKIFFGLKEKVRRDKLPFEEKEKPSCPYCKSDKILKNGKRFCKDRIKQTYKCTKCGRRFIEEKDFQKMKGDAKITTLILDLYFKGISLRKISDHLKQFYNLELDASNILRRIRKYSKVINDYVKTLKPELSDIWHHDEMMIQAGGKWRWLWNIMDKETKYLITRKVSDKRRIRDCIKVFKEAHDVAEKQPTFLITDGCVSYAEAVKRTLGRTNHIRLRSIRDKRTNNNVIERLNGTVRERLKVMRGLQSLETAEIMTEAYANYYNHIKIHSKLGTTPAVASGMAKLEGNRWKELIKKANL